MIPEISIENWRKTVKWQTPTQVEQDLIISRALVNLYNDPYIKKTLAFRGGTALNKLFIKPPSRYSEDIDLVQKNIAPIGQTIDLIKNILNPWLGNNPKCKITERSTKLIYKYEAINKLPAKIKIEINTTEHFHVLPFRSEKFNVDSDWFSDSTDITTYDINELMATKLRALYQRRKGRDLFDLWLVATKKLVNLVKVFEIFAEYCDYNKIQISAKEFIKNLELKKNHRDFKTDMNILLPSKLGWSFDEAYCFVVSFILKNLK